MLERGFMNKRPLSVTILSFLMIAVGVVGLAYHLTEFQAQLPFQYDLALVCLIHLTAIVCGAYMLRGSNWARWLTLAWLAFHAIVSGFHAWEQLVVHGLLFAAITYLLCCPQATEYFRAAKPATP